MSDFIDLLLIPRKNDVFSYPESPRMKTKITLLRNMLNKQTGASKKNGKMNLNFGFVDPSNDHSLEFIYTMSWNHKADKANLPDEKKPKDKSEKKLKNVLWQVAFFPQSLHRSWKQMEKHKKDAIKSKGKIVLAILYLLANAFSLYDGTGFDFSVF